MQKSASVHLLFGFEYVILASIVVSVFIKYTLSLIDNYLEGRWENKVLPSPDPSLPPILARLKVSYDLDAPRTGSLSDVYVKMMILTYSVSSDSSLFRIPELFGHKAKA